MKTYTGIFKQPKIKTGFIKIVLINLIFMLISSTSIFAAGNPHRMKLANEKTFADKIEDLMRNLAITKKEAARINLLPTFKQSGLRMSGKSLAFLSQSFICSEDLPFLTSLGKKKKNTACELGTEFKVLIDYYKNPQDARELFEGWCQAYKKKNQTWKDQDIIHPNIHTIKFTKERTKNSIMETEIDVDTNYKGIIFNKRISYSIATIKDKHFLISINGVISWFQRGNRCSERVTHCVAGKTRMKNLLNLYLKKIDELYPSISGKPKESAEQYKDLDVLISVNHPNFEALATHYDLNHQLRKQGVDTNSIKQVIIKGTVLSLSQNKPVPLANITINFKGDKYLLTSNAQGKYVKLLSVNPKGKYKALINLNLYLKEKPKLVVVRVLSKKFIADGRYQKLAIKLTDTNGKPLKNKVYLLSYKNFTYKGKNVNYITHPILTNTIKTDSRGIAVAEILTPKVMKNKLNNIKDSKKYFPITSQIILMKNSGVVGSFNINFLSPFPEITKILLPGGMDAEHWQITPSRIFIKDLDSDTFNIKLMGYGRFKTKGGKIYKTVFHQYRYKGNEFEFYFASGQLGLDLNKQPQVWKAFLETNMRVLMSSLITLNEGTSFEEMRKIKKRWLSAVLTNKASFKRVYGGSKLAFGAREYKNSAQAFLNSKNKDRVSRTDMVVGGAFIANDLVALIRNSSSKLKHNLQMELMKAIYENAKTTYGIYKKYANIVNSYRDLFKINIFIKVTDMDGYSTITTKPIFVKAWQSVKLKKGE